MKRTVVAIAIVAVGLVPITASADAADRVGYASSSTCAASTHPVAGMTGGHMVGGEMPPMDERASSAMGALMRSADDAAMNALMADADHRAMHALMHGGAAETSGGRR